jgi:hypothetical protein
MKRLHGVYFGTFLLICSSFMVVLIFVRYILPGISAPPEGDNVTIHIAIAKSILDGSFLNPTYPDILLYPASNEALLALFILLRLPINLFNILGLIFLFSVSVYVGRVFEFKKSSAYFFAIAICSAFGVLRWVLSQAIDIWLLAYFLLTLALLHKPKSSTRYYLLLGLSSGMLLGSRFTAPATLLSLFILYFHNFVKNLTVKRFFTFASMLSILGLFWYIRNYLVTGDPFYPQSFLIFKGACTGVCEFMSWTVGKSVILSPIYILNAFVSEYMIWSVAFLLLPIYFVITFFRRREKEPSITNKLILLGIINLIIYLFFPSFKYYDSVVVGVRYAYPAFGAFMLALFLLAKKVKYDHLLEIITVANLSFLVLPVSYHPKLLFIYVPVVTFLLLSLRRLHIQKSK